MNSEHFVRGHRPVHTRFGFRKLAGSGALSRPLPAISSLARELCTQRGFSVTAQGILPPGGTIVSVEDLNFDAALVLLSLFEDARVYADRAFDASPQVVQALSLRACCEVANAPVFESIVGDLASGRVVVLSSSHVRSLSHSLTSRTRVRRLCVDIARSSEVRVLTEV